MDRGQRVAVTDDRQVAVAVLQRTAEQRQQHRTLAEGALLRRYGAVRPVDRHVVFLQILLAVAEIHQRARAVGQQPVAVRLTVGPPEIRQQPEILRREIRRIRELRQRHGHPQHVALQRQPDGSGEAEVHAPNGRRAHQLGGRNAHEFLAQPLLQLVQAKFHRENALRRLGEHPLSLGIDAQNLLGLQQRHAARRLGGHGALRLGQPPRQRRQLVRQLRRLQHQSRLAQRRIDLNFHPHVLSTPTAAS